MSETRILIIHPSDRTTRFLESIKKELQRNFNEQMHYFSVKPNDESHKKCIERIYHHPNSGLIIFLGHGRSDALHGSKSDRYDAFVSEDVRATYPEDYYYNENFINYENIDVFKNKKVFCLSCRSAEKLAKMAIEKGASSFMGFGQIPTSVAEFEFDSIKAGEELVIFLKSELNLIIKKALSYSLLHNITFTELRDIIALMVNKRITYFLKERKKESQRFTVADYLYLLKKEIVIEGNKNLHLLS